MTMEASDQVTTVLGTIPVNYWITLLIKLLPDLSALI